MHVFLNVITEVLINVFNTIYTLLHIYKDLVPRLPSYKSTCHMTCTVFETLNFKCKLNNCLTKMYICLLLIFERYILYY